MTRWLACLLLWPSLAAAGPCAEFARVDLVMLEARTPSQTVAETSAVQHDCAALLAADPRDREARRQLARAQIAAQLFAEADESLAGLDQDGDGEASRLRGYLRAEAYLSGYRDVRGAEPFYRRAIALGDAPAMTLLGTGLSDAAWWDRGMVDPEGVALLDAAIGKGYAPALTAKARLINLSLPRLGTPEDSVHLAEAAVAAGWPEGKVFLAVAYRHGYGVPRDTARADALMKEWGEEVSPLVGGLEHAWSTFPPRP